jgi:undecaprenyl-diphosphatase
MHEFEKRIVVILNKYRWKTLDVFSSSISSILFLVTLWIAVACFVIFRDTLTGVFVCLGLAIVFMLHFIISEGILKWGSKLFSLERLRPYREYPDEIKPIGKEFQDSSFPSSHLTAMVGGLVVLVYFYNFIWPFAIAAAVTLALSRLHNGMHYPSDILAGIFLGLLYGYLSLSLLMFIF